MGRLLLLLCALATIGGCGPRPSYGDDYATGLRDRNEQRCEEGENDGQDWTATQGEACYYAGSNQSEADPQAALWYWRKSCELGYAGGCQSVCASTNEAADCDRAVAAWATEDQGSVPTGASTDAGCETCLPGCWIPNCSGADCYLERACACQCGLDHGGCGYAPAALQECVDENTQAAVGLYNAADQAADNSGEDSGTDESGEPDPTEQPSTFCGPDNPANDCRARGAY